MSIREWGFTFLILNSVYVSSVIKQLNFLGHPIHRWLTLHHSFVRQFSPALYMCLLVFEWNGQGWHFSHWDPQYLTLCSVDKHLFRKDCWYCYEDIREIQSWSCFIDKSIWGHTRDTVLVLLHWQIHTQISIYFNPQTTRCDCLERYYFSSLGLAHSIKIIAGLFNLRSWARSHINTHLTKQGWYCEGHRRRKSGKEERRQER